MKRMIILFLAVGLFLAGCGDIMDGSYHNTSENEVSGEQTEEQVVSVSWYGELHDALVEMIRDGKVNGLISVTRYDQNKVMNDAHDAVREVMVQDPIGAYAVEDIQFELGTSGGQPAIAVTVTYRHSRAQIQKIRQMKDAEQMWKAITGAMDRCESSVVLYVEKYEDVDFDLGVSAYSALNPDKVMEVPDVAVSVYPEEGRSRVVEVKFYYQNGRDVLKAMQSHVQSLFDNAMTLAAEGTQQERFAALYRVVRDPEEDLELETSITPAYSLLAYRVGDSRTVALVYAALCNKAELECMTVTGTKAGVPWYWNIVCVDGAYYHMDLLAGPAEGPRFLADQDMNGYVWDYSAYPECGAAPEISDLPTEPQGNE